MIAAIIAAYRRPAGRHRIGIAPGTAAQRIRWAAAR